MGRSLIVLSTTSVYSECVWVKVMRTNIVLDDALLEKIDETAREQGKNRSQLIREAAEKYISEHERRKAEARRKEKVAEAIRIQDELRQKAGSWNGAREIRKWRDRGR